MATWNSMGRRFSYEGQADAMTRELAQAIANYDKRPNFYRREIVVALVRDGHLTPVEYKRLQSALKVQLRECADA